MSEHKIIVCDTCRGTGTFEQVVDSHHETMACPDCDGTGEFEIQTTSAPAVKLLLDGEKLKTELKAKFDELFKMTLEEESLDQKTGLAGQAKSMDRVTQWIDSGRFNVTVPQEAERDYTPEEALAEARKRWGGELVVECSRYGDEMDCIVGTAGHHGVVFHGTSFRSAFAQADAQAEKEKV